jgi:hypothetical protein
VDDGFVEEAIEEGAGGAAPCDEVGGVANEAVDDVGVSAVGAAVGVAKEGRTSVSASIRDEEDNFEDESRLTKRESVCASIMSRSKRRSEWRLNRGTIS